MGRAPSPASDFWSLGAFLFEALCGKVSTGAIIVNLLDRRVMAVLVSHWGCRSIGSYSTVHVAELEILDLSLVGQCPLRTLCISLDESSRCSV